MTFEEFIKKLEVALDDKDTAEGLKSFGIEPEQIEGFKDLTIPSNLDEALKIKGVQSDYDKRLGKAAQTREENLKAKFNFVEKEGEEEEEEEIDTKDPAMKALMKKLTEMGNEITTLKQEKANETLEQKKTRAKEYLKSKGILPGYVHELDLDKDFEEQFETVKEKFEADGGTLITEDPKPKPGQKLPFPRNPGANNKPSKEEVEAFKLKI